MNTFSRFFPWLVVGAGLLYIGAALAPARQAETRLDDFGRLPILHNGREKPFDTLARTNLMLISRYQTYKDDNGVRQPAIRWLLDVMTSSMRRDEASRKVPGFRVENEQVRALLGLPAREGYLYAAEEFGANADKFIEEAKRARQKEPAELTPYDQALLELVQHISLYHEAARFETPHKVFYIENDQLLNMLNLPKRPGDYHYGFSEFLPRVGPLYQAAAQAQKRPAQERSVLDAKVLELVRRVELHLGLARFNLDTLQLAAPLAPGQSWKPLMDALHEAREGDENRSSAVLLAAILKAYVDGKPEPFNKAVAAYRDRLQAALPAELDTAGFETFFNRFDPLYLCIVLYVWVFLLGVLGWLGWAGPFNRAAFWLGVLTLVLHTWALTTRMVIQGRPPVTNLYSAAVFIGWGSVGLALIVEGLFRNGVGSVVAALLGGLSLLLGLHLATEGGDTLEMMQAVLDTNFWLATHVTIVTFGYVATLVAGAFGAIYILRGVFTRSLTAAEARSMTQMVYGTTCFALLLSFTGTVLGGIWADQSWGRFWGWDPKENGALLVVIANALLLHGRWGGLLKPRGIALLAVFGSMVTAWSYLGTNQLGIGLHAYGFNDKLNMILVGYWAANAAIILVGLLPLTWWRSFAPRPGQVRRAAAATT